MPGWSFKESEINLNQMTINLTGGQTTLTASGTNSSGTATCCMPIRGDDLKLVVIKLASYKHTNSPGQTYTFPTAFSQAPAVAADSGSIASSCTIATSSITLPASMGSAVTGFLVLIGI